MEHNIPHVHFGDVLADDLLVLGVPVGDVGGRHVAGHHDVDVEEVSLNMCLVNWGQVMNQVFLKEHVKKGKKPWNRHANLTKSSSDLMLQILLVQFHLVLP